jgi:hypothetical protein
MLIAAILYFHEGPGVPGQPTGCALLKALWLTEIVHHTYSRAWFKALDNFRDTCPIDIAHSKIDLRHLESSFRVSLRVAAGQDDYRRRTTASGPSRQLPRAIVASPGNSARVDHAHIRLTSKWDDSIPSADERLLDDLSLVLVELAPYRRQ